MAVPVHRSLLELRHKVDSFMQRVQETYPDRMRCSHGCASCCQAGLSVFPVEAEPMQHAFEELSSEKKKTIRQQMDDPTHCLFLLDGGCALYEQRPIICRSQGLPLLVERGAVDTCPLNFEGDASRADLPREDILNLKSVNFLLSMLHRVHIQESGKNDERVEFRALIR